jgi:hypothetical protein
VELTPEAPARVRLEQDRGLMEFEDGGMQKVETFRALAHVLPPEP